MKITCETLTELSNAIKQILEEFEENKWKIVSPPNDGSTPNDGSIWPLAKISDYKYEIDPYEVECLKTKATEARTCAIDLFQNLFQQNPELHEPPKPVSDPRNELLQIRLWCIRAEVPKQEKGVQGRGQPKNIEAEKSIDSLKELLEDKSKFSKMPRDTKKESWEWIADKIGYPKNPQNQTPRYRIMQHYLRTNSSKLYAKLKNIMEKN